MDNDLQALEAELKKLRPLAPSRELRERLNAELQSRARNRYVVWSWVGFPAAAAIAVVGILKWNYSPPAKNASVQVVSAPAEASEATFKPISADNVLLHASDEGYVTLTDGTPARRVRQSYVDTITWKNPRTNASLVLTVPREEVQVVPVNFQ